MIDPCYKMNSLAVHPGEGRAKSMDYRSIHLLDKVSRLSSFHPSSGKIICCLASFDIIDLCVLCYLHCF